MEPIIRNYIKIKRGKKGICNICRHELELTWDHIPPRSVLFEPDVITNTVFKGIPSRNDYMREYQSGIKYRTICKNCNGAIIGKNDVVYKKFVCDIIKQLSEVYENDAYVALSGQYIIVRVKVNKLLRSICGHFLAAKETIDDTIIDMHMRQYVFNNTLKPESFNVYSWIYPFSNILISRDFTCIGKTQGTHPKGVSSIIAAYPLAFLISDRE